MDLALDTQDHDITIGPDGKINELFRFLLELEKITNPDLLNF